jgi:hypothetical protein
MSQHTILLEGFVEIDPNIVGMLTGSTCVIGDMTSIVELGITHQCLPWPIPSSYQGSALEVVFF